MKQYELIEGIVFLLLGVTLIILNKYFVKYYQWLNQVFINIVSFGTRKEESKKLVNMKFFKYFYVVATYFLGIILLIVGIVLVNVGIK